MLIDMTSNPDLALVIFDVIRDIKDPERAENLFELGVVQEEDVTVIEKDGCVYIRIEFTPTVPHCHLATLIGLCIRVKVTREFPDKHKMDILLKEGSHSTPDDINKQINDKERVAAALENESLKKIVYECIGL